MVDVHVYVDVANSLPTIKQKLLYTPNVLRSPLVFVVSSLSGPFTDWHLVWKKNGSSEVASTCLDDVAGDAVDAGAAGTAGAAFSCDAARFAAFSGDAARFAVFSGGDATCFAGFSGDAARLASFSGGAAR